jgi:N-glycosylase/DNA lyase
MKLLIQQIQSIDQPTKDLIKERLIEFSSFAHKPNRWWFSELCFCILTANSRAKTAINIQKELGCSGFASYPVERLSNCIKKNKHRFHNNKASYIICARDSMKRIKDRIISIVKIEGQAEAREWLVTNVKGIGYKESSHFLRNVGYFDLAILDRHILNLMHENGYIQSKPKALTKRTYHENEMKLAKIAASLNMTQAELDMSMWYLKTKEVLK